jgi:PAS domain-containing protein
VPLVPPELKGDPPPPVASTDVVLRSATPIEPADTVAASPASEQRREFAELASEDRERITALRASEERLRLATEALAGFLYDWDPATNHLEWFGGMQDVLGFRLDEVTPDLAWYEARLGACDESR